jgi:hypothetical protein
MGQYDAIRASAAALIARKGATVTLTRNLPGVFNPITQTEVGGSVLAVDFHAVGLPPGKSAEFQIGSMVGRRIMQFWFAYDGQAIVPEPNDGLRWDGQDYVLIWSMTYDPAGDGAILTEAYAE